MGNSKVHKDNAMCNWVPGLLKEGETRSVVVVVGQRHVLFKDGGTRLVQHKHKLNIIIVICFSAIFVTFNEMFI